MEAERLLCMHLLNRGWAPIRQFEVGGKVIDVVATTDGEFLSIEIKLKDWRRGASQAFINQGYFHRSYLAVPFAVAGRALEVAKELGVGLIAFDDGSFEVVLQSVLNADVADIERLARQQPIPNTTAANAN